jgi:hypothetical protein
MNAISWYNQYQSHHIKEQQRKIIFTILDRECRSDSQSVDKLDEERTKPPRLEQPSILRLLRFLLSATNRPSSSLHYHS